MGLAAFATVAKASYNPPAGTYKFYIGTTYTIDNSPFKVLVSQCPSGFTFMDQNPPSPLTRTFNSEYWAITGTPTDEGSSETDVRCNGPGTLQHYTFTVEQNAPPPSPTPNPADAFAGFISDLASNLGHGLRNIILISAGLIALVYLVRRMKGEVGPREKTTITIFKK